MPTSICISTTESSQVGEVRRNAVELARSLNFGQTEQGKVGILATEAAKNLIKHAGGGQILLRSLHQENVSGIEILSVDKGPGMADLTGCLRDGYSTAGSPGTGMGAMSRLASLLDIYSLPGKGTVLLIQLWSQPLPHKGSAPKLEIGAICTPHVGEQKCGDGWAVRHGEKLDLLMLVDGLGHGEGAAKAAAEAMRGFQQSPHTSPVELLQQAHQILRPTRGAAMAVAGFELSELRLRFAGVGNIAGSVLEGEKQRSVLSHNGIVGYEARKFQEFIYPLSEQSLVVLHSDGLQSRWSLDGYPGLRARHPSTIAGVLYRDFQRPRDDVTVIVARAARSK